MNAHPPEPTAPGSRISNARTTMAGDSGTQNFVQPAYSRAWSVKVGRANTAQDDKNKEDAIMENYIASGQVCSPRALHHRSCRRDAAQCARPASSWRCALTAHRAARRRARAASQGRWGTSR